MRANALLGLKTLDQSVWLDDIHRRMLDDGTLAKLIAEDGLAGLTSNPSIFAAAMGHDKEYVQALASLDSASTSMERYETLAFDDLIRAADLFGPVYDRSQRRDGFVSIEVSPQLASQAEATVAEARRLWRRIDRPNAMIKVPGTTAGLEAIPVLIAAGINVNVTLLFSVERYRAVAQAYMAGLTERASRGESLAGVASVASFFLSRIDTHMDRLLDDAARCGRVEARALRGRTAVACAARAYEQYRSSIDSPRWHALAARGAQAQRLLWASTSTKDPAYSDILYVEECIARDTINTMPLATLAAYRDHGRPEPRLEHAGKVAHETLAALARLGIDLEEAATQLEREGVDKFIESFEQLQRSLGAPGTATQYA